MMFLLIFLFLVACFLGAYTMNFQKTTIIIANRLDPENARSMQNAITTPAQVIRNFLFPINILAVFILGLIVTKWYFAIPLTLGIFILGTLISKFIMPEPESGYYLNVIKRVLKRRAEVYLKMSDSSKLEVARIILNKLDKL